MTLDPDTVTEVHREIIRGLDAIDWVNASRRAECSVLISDVMDALCTMLRDDAVPLTGLREALDRLTECLDDIYMVT